MILKPYRHNEFKGIEIQKRENMETKSDVNDIASTLREEGTNQIKSDTDGSYTGMSFDGEVPVQDADDL